LKEIPSNVKGVGLTEATRGALAHYIDIGDNGFIRNYEMVVPTTWNISPKDNKDIPGALESMLIGTKIKDEENPIEIARIIRSTDPCLACAVH
jgi:hydrogenase large subunit